MPARNGSERPRRSRLSKPLVAVSRRILRKFAHSLRLTRPVFILAPPRSGSTLLFDALSRTGQFHYYPVENDWVWWRLFPPDRLAEPSDMVGAEEAAANAQRLRTALRNQILGGYLNRMEGLERLARVASLLVHPSRPLLDKTIANCFHLDALRRVFPHARYVLLVRDPRANISSMIEGWSQLGRFGKPLVKPWLERVSQRTVDHWCYPVPPGWRRVVTRPLAEICAWSWKQHIQKTLEFFGKTGIEPIFIRYEELTTEPAKVLRGVARRLDTNISEAVLSHWRGMPLSRTTVSRPGSDKWRRLHGPEIRAVLPSVMDTARHIGYDLSDS